MDRMFEDVSDPADLRELAQVHDGDAIRDIPNRGHVMGDHQVREPHLPLQRHEAIEDLCLDGDIERAGRLVEDDDLRVHDEGSGEGETLPAPAGELMRILIECVGG
jgi:hypothetical protein